MARSRETFSKKENEKNRQKRKKEKEEKRQERLANSKKGKGFEEMLAYVDENGSISSTPPDPRKRKSVNIEDIQIGVPRQDEIGPNATLRNGTVTFYNEDKGYGFIRDLQTGESIFVHATGLLNPIKENNKVTFEVQRGPKGLNAVSVTPV